MTNREKLKRRVVELIHGLPIEEVKEMHHTDAYSMNCTTIDNINGIRRYYFPITLSRVMQALGGKFIVYNDKKGLSKILEFYGSYSSVGAYSCGVGVVWKLTKENGETATDDDQTDETILSILELLA